MRTLLFVFLVFYSCGSKNQTMLYQTDIKILQKHLKLIPEDYKNIRFYKKSVSSTSDLGPTDYKLYCFLEYNSEEKLNEHISPTNTKLTLPKNMLTGLIPDKIVENLTWVEEKYTPTVVYTLPTIEKVYCKTVYAIKLNDHSIFACFQSR